MNPVKAWNDFWFRPISARPLAAFRVVIGVLAIAQVVLLSFDVDYWLTDQGLVQGAEARTLAGPLRPSPLQWVQDPITIRAVLAATGLVAAAVAVGWHTRLATIALYLLMLSIHHRNILTNCGPDNLLLLLIFYLMISPCGRAYSLDARREAKRRGTVAEPIIVPWAQRLIQLHLSLIYFDTAVLKCAGTTWLGGTALHFVLYNSEVGRFDFSFLNQYPVLISALTQVALVAEFLLPFLLWFRSTRPWMIAIGLGLHGTILFIVNVPMFGELMTACYLTFLSVGELDTMLRALDVRRWLPARRTRAALPRDVRIDGPQSPQGMHAPVYVEEPILVHSE
ncbi:MAG: HTTM domain-containing protein [Isosphaeraceae bacterium]